MKLKLGKFEIEINITFSWEKSYLKEVKQALREGRRLQAVKIYMNATGLGLKDSKDAVDLLLPKYYKDYKPNPNCESSNAEVIPDVQTFPNPKYKVTHGIVDRIKSPCWTDFVFTGSLIECWRWRDVDGTYDESKYKILQLSDIEQRQYNQPKPMFGACKASTDLFSNIMNPQPLFVGTLDQCQKWADDNRMVCTMIGLNQDEVNKYIRNKLTQRNEVPNPNCESSEAGKETPPDNPKPRE